MIDQPDNRIQELQIQLAARDRIRQELTAAQENLDRELYRLDTTELALAVTQTELDKFASLNMSSLFSSLAGTKTAKIDGLRQEFEAVRREQRECQQAVETLKKTVERLNGELAGFADIEAEFQALSSVHDTASSSAGPSAHDVRRALDAGKSLLTGLSGMYRTCTRLRGGQNTFVPRGALFAAAAQAWGNKAAGSATGQIAGSVRHFHTQLGRLNIGRDYLPDIAVLMPQLELFADPSSLGSNAGVDAWADIEAMTRNIVADLEEELRRLER